MNLILVGYRGTGKSTIARELARVLDMPRVSLDEELQLRANQSISELVAAHGWDHFRDLEQTLVAELAQSSGRILDCGGGVVERNANVAALRSAGTVFWLVASTEAIVQRISGGTERPSLTTNMTFTEEVATVLLRRTPLYRDLAHVRIDTDRVPTSVVVGQILSLWPHGPAAAAQPQTLY